MLSVTTVVKKEDKSRTFYNIEGFVFRKGSSNTHFRIKICCESKSRENIMFFIMDANAIIDDYYLNSFEFKQIQQNSEKLGIKLFLSSVVFDEVVQKYRERLYEFNRKNKGYHYIPSKYLNLIPEDEIESLVDEYKNILIRKLADFNRLGTRVYEFEQIDFCSVYNKAINKELPFSNSDKGFKDAMIWEHVKCAVNLYCDNYRKLAFITTNIGDFCGLEKKQDEKTVWYYPAKELRKEYMDKGYREDTVRIYPSIKSFYLDMVIGRFQRFDEYINELNTCLNEELKAFIFNELSQQYVDLDSSMKSPKAVLTARAVAGFNSYGQATYEDIVILCKADLLLESDKTILIKDIYLHVDLNKRKFIYMEI